MKLCKRCEVLKPFTAYHTRKTSKDGYAYYCKICFKDWAKNRIDSSAEGRIKDLLISIRSRGKKSDMEINITLEYLLNLYNKQGGKCALTGVSLTFPRGGSYRDKRITTTLSLDRIESNLGYIIGNVQFVTHQVNIAKNCYTTEKFLEMCNLVTEKNLKT